MVTVLDNIRSVEQAAEWVRQERLRQGWTAKELAERLVEAAKDIGEELTLTQQAISFFERGKAKSLPRWLRYFEIVRISALVDDRQRNYDDSDGDLPAPANDDQVEIDSIDLSYGLGGTFLDTEDIEIEKATFSRGWLRQFTDSPPNMLFSTQGAGDSMWPTIHDRDVVIVDRSQKVVDQGDKIWAIVFGGVGMIKRLRPMPDGTVKILSDNQSIPPELATDGDLFIVGRIAAIVRRV